MGGAPGPSRESCPEGSPGQARPELPRPPLPPGGSASLGATGASSRSLLTRGRDPEGRPPAPRQEPTRLRCPRHVSTRHLRSQVPTFSNDARGSHGPAGTPPRSRAALGALGAGLEGDDRRPDATSRAPHPCAACSVAATPKGVGTTLPIMPRTEGRRRAPDEGIDGANDAAGTTLPIMPRVNAVGIQPMGAQKYGAYG